MKNILVLNPENVSDEEIQTFDVREAARAVVFDADGKVALLHVTKYDYYKLPGGGLEGSEDRIVALKRECIEEIGCDVEITGEIGSIIEYRRFENLKQVSYCYAARVIGEKRSPQFTEGEMKEGFEVVWTAYDDARARIEENKATNVEGKEYIVPRDIAFLRESKNI